MVKFVLIYENDFSKHNGKVNSRQILMVFYSIVSQFAKSNEKQNNCGKTNQVAGKLKTLSVRPAYFYVRRIPGNVLHPRQTQAYAIRVQGNVDILDIRE